MFFMPVRYVNRLWWRGRRGVRRRVFACGPQQTAQTKEVVMVDLAHLDGGASDWRLPDYPQKVLAPGEVLVPDLRSGVEQRDALPRFGIRPFVLLYL
jgi:hypothetical protein